MSLNRGQNYYGTFQRGMSNIICEIDIDHITA
jgi:hypothetical protein